MTTSAGHVLIVEDEPRLAGILGDYLRAAGFGSDWVADGDAVLPAFRAQAPDLVLLDLMLPGRDGIDLCRALREESAVPIIMITARVEEIDRLLGLEVGADDYICKPFSVKEVIARIGAVLRRTRGEVRAPGAEPYLTIDDGEGRAYLQGALLDLTTVEFRLLRTFMQMPGRIWSRDQLLDHLYNDHRVVTDRTVDSHIRNLRRKLRDAGLEDDPIHSIYGVGYRFEMPAIG